MDKLALDFRCLLDNYGGFKDILRALNDYTRLLEVSATHEDLVFEPGHGIALQLMLDKMEAVGQQLEAIAQALEDHASGKHFIDPTKQD